MLRIGLWGDSPLIAMIYSTVSVACSPLVIYLNKDCPPPSGGQHSRYLSSLYLFQNQQYNFAWHTL